MGFFSEYFICHFYFLWPKIMSKIFTPKTICCSRLFFKFFQFYFWFCIFHSLQSGSTFLATLFNAFVIIEWFDLNSSFNSLFEILSINASLYFIYGSKNVKIFFIRINYNKHIAKLFVYCLLSLYFIGNICIIITQFINLIVLSLHIFSFKYIFYWL